jgi:hypothetical protein
MTLSALGIFSAAGAGGGAPAIPAYELIESTILTGTQASVTFSGLGTYSSTYKHLQVRATFRSTHAATDIPVNIQLNGITSASYSYHIMYTSGTGTVSSFGAANNTSFYLGNFSTGSTSTANIFGTSVIDLLDPYSTTKNKTLRALSGVLGNSNITLGVNSGAFLNTASVTSLTIFPDTRSWAAGSRFSIYGVKG